MMYFYLASLLASLFAFTFSPDGGDPMLSDQFIFQPETDTRRRIHTGTFDGDLSHGLDNTQGGHGHAGVVGRLHHVGELQHVAADGHVVLRSQVLGAQHPLDVGHGRAHRHAGDVHAAARHDLAVRRRDGEAWWDPTHCRERKHSRR